MLLVSRDGVHASVEGSEESLNICSFGELPVVGDMRAISERDGTVVGTERERIDLGEVWIQPQQHPKVDWEWRTYFGLGK